MNAKKLIESLRRFPLCLEPLIMSLSVEDARWKPATGQWSVLEIVCHLRDEESQDFRTRLRLTLQDPQAVWPSIDPPRAAVDRRYNEDSLPAALRSFLAERQQSIAWLQSLSAPDWDCFHVHPQLGKFSAGDLLAAWSAHDWLHLRQVSKRLFEQAAEQAGRFSTRYAGEW